MFHRAHLADVFSCIVALVACVSGTSNRPPNAQNPPSQAALTSLGYYDVVEFGLNAARDQGFSPADLEKVESIGVNLWRVRFGLVPKESGKVLEVDIDGTNRRLLRMQALDRLGIAAGLNPITPDGG